MINGEKAFISRQGTDADAIAAGFEEHLKYSLAMDPNTTAKYDRYYALVFTIRDRLIERWLKTKKAHGEDTGRKLYYFSIEYLMGRAIGNNIINLGIQEQLKEAMKRLGVPLQEIRELEHDKGLGNGGLGRLAACFLDSLATLDYAAIGYGLRYEFGIFKQEIVGGYQVEKPDDWLKYGNPWEIKRPDIPCVVQFGGRLEKDEGSFVRWTDTDDILGIPYDIPIVGYGGRTINILRLWRASSLEKFDYTKFNQGDYYYSVDKQARAESLTKVLYPNDSFNEGKELRFKQEYFFVACSIQDILRRFRKLGLPYTNLSDKTAIQLNDTHPALAIPELMRKLVDEERIPWDVAWNICHKIFGFTNHTLMPEALEVWPVEMFEKYLPRHIEIIYQINQKFLQKVSTAFPYDMGKLANMSIIGENGNKHVRMANLSVVGSNTVNGVAELHTRLLKERLAKDFYEMYPDKFINITNGITQRRWLLKANPSLSNLITETIGDKWITELTQLEKLNPLASDPSFQDKFKKAKREAKHQLRKQCITFYGIDLDPDSIFDIQVKRIHEYKRQLMNILHVIYLYDQVRKGKKIYPHTFLLGGKAASGYTMAKLIIKLICNVSTVINRNTDTNSMIKVYFLWDYGVSLAEKIIPAADISEQISTAGTEASGTSNMKFMLNGALTIGTFDGANVEIAQEVGMDNIFIFGKNADEIAELKKGYNPTEWYMKDQAIKEAVDLIFFGHFDLNEPGVFSPIQDMLLKYDTYMHFVDLPSYIEAHEAAWNLYTDSAGWNKKAILNVAAAGKFSSDRSIREYAEKIWKIKPVKLG
ncbi:MAG: glycogen/starch/alpha-glucan phosphorylase [Spirochaetia bacterium]|jgi:starch phosphorylase|nr:glycogen/starch/alpha-glucan phosphorylase [Spirochaetia bacterium]